MKITTIIRLIPLLIFVVLVGAIYLSFTNNNENLAMQFPLIKQAPTTQQASKLFCYNAIDKLRIPISNPFPTNIATHLQIAIPSSRKDIKRSYVFAEELRNTTPGKVALRNEESHTLLWLYRQHTNVAGVTNIWQASYTPLVKMPYNNEKLLVFPHLIGRNQNRYSPIIKQQRLLP